MRVIDLLVKISKGEEVPKKIRIDHWCYNFEWNEKTKQYWDYENEMSLEDALSFDKEELNFGVQIIEEPKKLEKLNLYYYVSNDLDNDDLFSNLASIIENQRSQEDKINDIIDYLMEIKNDNN